MTEVPTMLTAARKRLFRSCSSFIMTSVVVAAPAGLAGSFSICKSYRN